MPRTELTFRLDVPLKTKARPRSAPGQSRPYTPADYRAWKEDCRAALAAVWEREGLPILGAVESISIEMHGPGRGDPDNLIGALFDAGIPDKRAGWPGVWQDDRVTRFPSGCWHWFPSREQFWVVRICCKCEADATFSQDLDRIGGPAR